MGLKNTELAEKELSQSNSFSKRLRRRIGFIISLIGFARALFTYAANIIGQTVTIWPIGGPWLGVLLPMSGLPILALGFLLYADWKKDLSFTRQKEIILGAFMLFFPAPWIAILAGGYSPPVFILLGGIFALFHLNCFASVWLLNSGISLCLGHILACFLCKHIKNRFFPWIVFAVLAVMSLFPIYYWGFDCGSGGGNIFTSFKQLFIGL